MTATASRAGRLTDVERRERALSERDFQRQVTDLAEALGWTWAHFRALQNRRGMWQVPVEGPLGEGWPDIFAIRVRDQRVMAIELKRELGHLTAEQAACLAALEACGVETHVWKPSGLRDPIEESPIYQALR